MPIVIYWADEPQFALKMPKVNPGFTPPTEQAICNFVDQLVKTYRMTLGDDWWDCTMLRKVISASGIPTTHKLPMDDDFTRIDV